MFISELFEGKGMVPSNPKQKQGPAGQARGTDKAPFRNKLVGEDADPSWQKGWDMAGKDPSGDPVFLFRKYGRGLNGTAFVKGFNDHAKSLGVKTYGGAGGSSLDHNTMRYREIARDRGMGEALEREPQYADADFSKPMFGEGDNPQDEITMDVPLLIRLLEYAREDAKTDMDLHNVAEQLIKLSGQGCLSMEQYDQIVGGIQEGGNFGAVALAGAIALGGAMGYKHATRDPNAEPSKASQAFKTTPQRAYDAGKLLKQKITGVKEMTPGREAYAGRGNVPGMAT